MAAWGIPDVLYTGRRSDFTSRHLEQVSADLKIRRRDEETKSIENPSLRKLRADKLVRDVIGFEGGPLIHNGSEDEQRPFDSTCRKFYRFLTQTQS